MKQCSQNENHWYSNHLSYCPWCEITDETGKDPFPSSIKPQPEFRQQISVTPARVWSSKPDITEPDQTDQGVNPHVPSSINPTNTPRKNNAVIYKSVSFGLIICLLVLIGNAMINWNDRSPNNLPDTSPGVSPTSNNLLADDDKSSGVDTVTFPEQPIFPVADFSASTTFGEAPLTVTFNDKSTGSSTSWSWDFGDGVILTKKNPTHTYSTAGIYTVKETVRNDAGEDTETKTDYIIVTAPVDVNADFSVSTTSGEAPLTVTFKDKSIGSPTSWSWDFGDGVILTKQNPTHTYSIAGIYTVKETVRNDASEDTETKIDFITVTAPMENVDPVNTAPLVTASPVDIVNADFSASVTSGKVPLTVKFTDQSTGSPNTWKWNFGDGSDLIMEYNPTHTYSTAGVYTVKETVSNENGKDTEIKTNYITVTATDSLNADFSASSTSGEAPLTVTFSDKSTGSPTLWSWDFGDGATSTEKDPTHEYAAGTYTVRLEVQNSAGSDTAFKGITVEEPTRAHADFTWDIPSEDDPLTVKFTDTSIGSPTSWSWEFGDGATSTEKDPTHEYAAGTYTVKLEVQNSAGSDTASKEITVEEPTRAHADFTWDIPSEDDPLTVKFTDTSYGAILWWWDFGDGDSSEDQNPTHTYKEAGTYHVNLQAHDTADVDSVTYDVTVTSPAVAIVTDFEVNVPTKEIVTFTP